MLIKKSGSLEGRIASSEITPKDAFFNRRNFLLGAAAVGVGALALKQVPGLIHPEPVHADQQLVVVPSKYKVPDAQTPFAKATTYNNYYEFGTDKSDPAKNAHTLRTRPWTVEVAGLVKKKQTLDIDTVIKYRPTESRVYRHRCVEAWSMVIPWDGYSFSEFISAMEPLPSAKYGRFRRSFAQAHSFQPSSLRTLPYCSIICGAVSNFLAHSASLLFWVADKAVLPMPHRRENLSSGVWCS